jgi:hypothetical protein
MNKIPEIKGIKKIWAIIPGFVLIMTLFILFGLLIIKLLWAWVIPDIFPGAVEKGLIASSISWFTAFKVALLVFAFSRLAGIGRKRSE